MVTPAVLVVGEALTDVVAAADGTHRAHPGGSPANVALGLARLGHPVELATRIGRDAHGRTLRGHLEASGVRLTPGSETGSPTSTATARLDTSGGARYRFDIRWELPETVRPTGYGHLHTGSIATALPPGADRVRKLIAEAPDHCTVSYDPNLRPALLGPAAHERAGVEELVAAAHVVKASEEDLAWLYPDEAPDTVAARWSGRGPALVVLTRGAEGARAYWASAGRLDVPPVPVTVADTIGAGDAFMAGLLSGLLAAGLLGDGAAPRLREAARGTTAHPDLAHALRLAARVSALTCARPGADPPYAKEVSPS
ncbi:carbohydrate kinase [Streptomyces sp. TRM49041]|uniref:carbohydrate kinase family protein n=1 Tax=Streptomyces sp. TRM49041 TaxID=2603216 RepID=UPI0011ED3ADE|nr:carbohydrate kinase [Streptomyces sp. TRM49041]